MTVCIAKYCVGDYSSYSESILGVYSSKEKAEEAVQNAVMMKIMTLSDIDNIEFIEILLDDVIPKELYY